MTPSFLRTIATTVRAQAAPADYDSALFVVLFPHDVEAQPVAMLIDGGLTIDPGEVDTLAAAIDRVGVEVVVPVIPRSDGRPTESDRTMTDLLCARTTAVDLRCALVIGPTSMEVLHPRQISAA